MRVAIHQPHFFPWLGYFDKMAKSDVFVLLDEVQFEKGSQMNRNRVLDNNGQIKYITMSYESKSILDKPYGAILTVNQDIWKTRTLNALRNYYKGSDYYVQALDILVQFFNNDYLTLCDWSIASIQIVKDILELNTPLIKQSSIEYDKKSKNTDLVRSICKELKADKYVSGRGASLKYLNNDAFLNDGIEIVVQTIGDYHYKQVHNEVFTPGLSFIDALFNLGKKGTKELFWNMVEHGGVIPYVDAV